METVNSRINIYALLSRVLLQEIDSDVLEMIKKDENILEFFPTLKDWKQLKEVDNKTLLEEYFNPDFVNS